jgi:hypothetical protein
VMMHLFQNLVYVYICLLLLMVLIQALGPCRLIVYGKSEWWYLTFYICVWS